MHTKVSRRTILRGAAVAAGAVPVLLSGMSAQAANKQKKETVKYQTQPNKAGQHCSICANYIDPKQCKVVEGEIDPNGSCKLFVKKA